jgi:hypothetical protein
MCGQLLLHSCNLLFDDVFLFFNILLILFSLDLLLLGLDLFLFANGFTTGLRHYRLDDHILSFLGFESKAYYVSSGGIDFIFDFLKLLFYSFSILFVRFNELFSCIFFLLKNVKLTLDSNLDSFVLSRLYSILKLLSFHFEHIQC